MHDPLDFEKTPVLSRLRRLRQAARLVLLWEQSLRGFWRAVCWTAFFFALWLLEIPAMFGHTTDILTVLIFFAGLYYFVRAGVQDFQLPGLHAADRRLEQDSGVGHRPLAHIEDRLANPQQEQTRTLWDKGVEGAFAAIHGLRPPRLQPQLAARDTHALRFLAFLFLVVGFFTAGPQWGSRLTYGLFPFSGGAQSAEANDNVVLWITPPEYTHLPRITIQGGGSLGKTVDVPEGSAIKARVKGGFGQPVLVMGESRQPLQRLDDKNSSDKNWGIETKAVDATSIKISQFFFPRASIPIHYIADQPPTITLKSVQTLPKGPLQFDVTVSDDYGVSSLTLRMKPDPATTAHPLGGPVEEERAIVSAAGQETELKPVYDMTWHPWAGMPVILELEAKDAQGHTAAITPVHMALPERPFYNPVAKQLVDLRKRLSWSPVAAASNVAYDIESLIDHPDTFGGDAVTFLSLRSAASRLIWDHAPEAAPAVVSQLWDTALRVEDGNISLAARDLRDAQQELQKLLDDPKSTPDQIAAAMDRLRGAMASYFQELYRELQKRQAEGGQKPISPDMFKNKIDADSLAAFMEQLQSQALSGDRDAARQMLSQLQQMTDRMDPSMSMEMPPQVKAMMKAMEGVQKLIQRQKDLMDKTKKAQDSAAKQDKGAEKPESAKDQQAEQETLRHDLGQLMLDAGEAMDKIPDSLQKAEQEMRGASAALGDNKPGDALPHEAQAVDELQKGEGSMQQQLKSMMQQMTMMSFGMGPLDPMGRPMKEGNGNSLLPDPSIKIPDEAQRKKAQEILKVLRRRSGELSRPDYELDYFKRLMKQF